MDTTLSDLSDEQLAQLRDAIPEEIKNRLAMLEKKLAALRGPIKAPKTAATPNRTKGTKLPIKYRDPDNQEFTWTGRGMKPVWLHVALKAGKSLDHFRVEPNCSVQ